MCGVRQVCFNSTQRYGAARCSRSMRGQSKLLASVFWSCHQPAPWGCVFIIFSKHKKHPTTWEQAREHEEIECRKQLHPSLVGGGYIAEPVAAAVLAGWFDVCKKMMMVRCRMHRFCTVPGEMCNCVQVFRGEHVVTTNPL